MIEYTTVECNYWECEAYATSQSRSGWRLVAVCPIGTTGNRVMMFFEK